MPESNWVKAEDLELGDEIRFMQKIWDVKKEDWTGESRQIQGHIVKLDSYEATLSSSEGLIVKRIKTIENGTPERLVGKNEDNRQPTVWLRAPWKRRYRYNPDLDPMVQSIAMDDASEARMKLVERLKREQSLLPEANTPASKPEEQQ
jgi:hypothetical protein